jgi:hypothetical protein
VISGYHQHATTICGTAVDARLTWQDTSISIRAAPIPPLTHGRSAFASVDIAPNDIVRVIGARPVAGRADLNGTTPPVDANATVEADTVCAVLAGAPSVDGGEDTRGEEEREY